MSSDYWKHWAKNNTKSISVRFNRNNSEDWELFEHVKKQPNQSQYVKALILRDKILSDICIAEMNDLKRESKIGEAMLEGFIADSKKEEAAE